MFVLLQRRNQVGLVLTVEDQNDPALEAFMDRFNISKTCGPLFYPLPPRSSRSFSKPRGWQYRATCRQRICSFFPFPPAQQSARNTRLRHNSRHAVRTSLWLAHVRRAVASFASFAATSRRGDGTRRADRGPLAKPERFAPSVARCFDGSDRGGILRSP